MNLLKDFAAEQEICNAAGAEVRQARKAPHRFIIGSGEIVDGVDRRCESVYLVGDCGAPLLKCIVEVVEALVGVVRVVERGRKFFGCF